ncbi:cell division protein FtsA [bacterium]|nr:MAG: cell division protein FtsA [bacterium]
MKKIIAGIDIGSTKIACIVSSVKDGEEPKVIGVASQPSMGIKKGVVVNIDQATKAISMVVEAAERMAGVRVNSVYITVNGKHLTSTNNKGVVATADPNEISQNDVLRAIESARTISIPSSREIIHVVPREFIIDTQPGIKDPIGMSGSRLEVDAHIVSAVSNSLQNLVKCVEALGLNVTDIVFTGWASTISTLSETEKQLGVTLLDIGGGTTSICSFIEDAITYSGSLEYGGMNLTSDMAIVLRTTLEDAEKLKINLNKVIDYNLKTKLKGSDDATAYQRLMSPKKDKKEDEQISIEEEKDMLDISILNIGNLQMVSKKMIERIIEARLKEIFGMCKDQIEQAGFNPRMPAGVVITGGSAMIPGIAQIAQSVFGIPARVAYPKGLGGMIEEVENPQFSALQGLIMHAAVYGMDNEPQLKTGNTLRGNGSVEDNLKGGIFDKVKRIFGGMKV